MARRRRADPVRGAAALADHVDSRRRLSRAPCSGIDFPNAATELRILSTIFIRLIRTIVAPLLFATLVVGIAGARQPQTGRAHGRSRRSSTSRSSRRWRCSSDGRRSRISRAGVGITLPPPPPGEQTAAPAAADVAGHRPARLPGEHREGGGRRRGAAGRRLQRDLRRGARHAARSTTQAARHVRRERSPRRCSSSRTS